MGASGSRDLYLDSYYLTWRTGFFPDRNTGRVGIGTITPQNRLDVSGSACVGSGVAGSTANLRFRNGGQSSWRLFKDDTDQFHIKEAGSGDDMSFDPSGHAGIGTASPGSLLTVAGPESDIPGTGSIFGMQNEANANNFFGFRIGATGNRNIYLDSYYGGMQNLITLDRETGRLGLKTTTPKNKLDLAGSMVVGSSYAGAVSAPSNGLLVEGSVGIGTTLVFADYGLFVNGNVELDGDRQITFQSGTDPMKVEFWGDGTGLGLNSNELFYAATGTHSFRKAPGGHETMTLTTGSDGGLRVFGSGASYFMGPLGLNTATLENSLDVGGAMTVGSALAGTITAPANSLLIQNKLHVGIIGGYRFNLKDGQILVENSSEHDKLELGLNADGAGYLKTYGDPSTRNVEITADSDHCNYGLIQLYDDTGACKVEFQAGVLDYGRILTKGETGTRNTECGCFYPDIDAGLINVFDSDGYSQASLYIDLSGQNIVNADYKWLKWDDPRDETREIGYGCIEGPEAAIYARGTGRLSRGKAVIALPDHFAVSAFREGLTVQVTSLSAESQGLAVVEKSAEYFVVRELSMGDGTYSFDWKANAVRNGRENYGVIRDSSVLQPQFQSVKRGL